MLSMQNFRVPRQSVGYLLFCLLGITIFLAAGLGPAYLRLKALARSVAELETEVAVQEKIRPVYLQVSTDASLRTEMAYAIPQEAALPLDSISMIPVLFGKIAHESNMEFVSAYPSLQSMSTTRSQVMVTVVCHGKWQDFRTFLVRLAEMPYVDHIDEIDVVTESGTLREYTVHVWILIQ